MVRASGSSTTLTARSGASVRSGVNCMILSTPGKMAPSSTGPILGQKPTILRPGVMDQLQNAAGDRLTRAAVVVVSPAAVVVVSAGAVVLVSPAAVVVVVSSSSPQPTTSIIIIADQHKNADAPKVLFFALLLTSVPPVLDSSRLQLHVPSR